MNISDEEFQLKQRLCDLVRGSSERYTPGFTKFLDGADLTFAKNFVNSSPGCVAFCFGGFPNAQRCIVGVFPSEIYDVTVSSDDEFRSMFELAGIYIKGSGYRKFTHRDILGSLLALGIRRETVGDICVSEDGFSAYVAVVDSVAQFLCESLDFIGNDKVKVTSVDVCSLPEIKREYRMISGTVASFRLDCVVSLCTGLSREKSKKLVDSGFVSVNHRETDRCDTVISENDMLSVRGHGRFVVFETGDVTKKGRNRIVVGKLI